MNIGPKDVDTIARQFVPRFVSRFVSRVISDLVVLHVLLHEPIDERSDITPLALLFPHMASYESMTDEGLACLFGLGLEAQVHNDRLKAGKTFRRIRDKLEADGARLKNLAFSTFQKSTKRKLFTESTEHAATGQGPESLVLRPLIEDDSISLAQSRRRLMLVSYSLIEKDFKDIVENDLVKIFPRLTGEIEIQISKEIETHFIEVLNDVWTGKEGHDRILRMSPLAPKQIWTNEQ
jgi:hypothetical protein